MDGESEVKGLALLRQARDKAGCNLLNCRLFLFLASKELLRANFCQDVPLEFSSVSLTHGG